jgi:hypothetical protein
LNFGTSVGEKASRTQTNVQRATMSIARFLEFQVCAVVLLRPARDPVPYCHCQYHNTHPDPPVPAPSWSQPSLRGPGQPPPTCRSGWRDRHGGSPADRVALVNAADSEPGCVRPGRAACQAEAHRRVGSESLAVRPAQPATGSDSDSEPEPRARPPTGRLPGCSAAAGGLCCLCIMMPGASGQSNSDGGAATVGGARVRRTVSRTQGRVAAVGPGIGTRPAAATGSPRAQSARRDRRAGSLTDRPRPARAPARPGPTGPPSGHTRRRKPMRRPACCD